MQQTLYLCTVFKRLKIFHKFVWFRLVVSKCLRVGSPALSFFILLSLFFIFDVLCRYFFGGSLFFPCFYLYFCEIN